MGEPSTRLVVIRGNSGSGKSTVAADHRGVTRCYVYDLSFEETVRRHATKPVPQDFGEDEMRDWWHGLQTVDGLGEAIIDCSSTSPATVGRILDDCWPDRSRPR